MLCSIWKAPLPDLSRIVSRAEGRAPPVAGCFASAWGDSVRNSLYGEAPRPLAVLPKLPHFPIGGFDVTPVTIGVEQRVSEPVSLESGLEGAEQREVGRKPQRQGLVLFEILGHQFGKAYRREQTCPYPSRKRTA